MVLHITWQHILKLPYRSQLINFIIKYFKELAYIYIMIKYSKEGLCDEF